MQAWGEDLRYEATSDLALPPGWLPACWGLEISPGEEQADQEEPSED